MENNFLDSKLFKGIILGIGGLLILIFIFNLGVLVGMKKAEFSFRWAEQYHRNFGGPQGGIFGEFMDKDREFANANGVFGQIIKINDGSLTIKDKNLASSTAEKIILVNEKTIIVCQKKNIKLSDLKIDDNIVVVGEPNDNGQIQAILIRIMPALLNNLPTI